ncbi:MAG: methyltransferase domain-containing protein [Coxiellaceae bacterium]|nr:MAG: methyltransferase domain-containing protein [Coxiellaceae bacterium]
MQETYLEMQNWFDHVPGNLVLQAESRALDKLMPNLLGYHLLQLGGPQVNLLHNCRIPHRIHISPACPCSFPGTCLVGDYTQLPFLPESIDVALLPHVLEFSKQPRAILEQVSQVLSPRGKVIILGLQPFSMWG